MSVTDAFHYRPQRSCGQGNVFTGVCLSTGGRVYASVHAGIPDPPRTRQTPLDQADPLGPGRHPLPAPGSPPGPGRPPWTRQTPRDQHTPPLDQADPPPGSRLQHTVYERLVHILLECILVKNIFTLTSSLQPWDVNA